MVLAWSSADIVLHLLLVVFNNRVQPLPVGATLYYGNYPRMLANTYSTIFQQSAFLINLAKRLANE